MEACRTREDVMSSSGRCDLGQGGADEKKNNNGDDEKNGVGDDEKNNENGDGDKNNEAKNAISENHRPADINLKEVGETFLGRAKRFLPSKPATETPKKPATEPVNTCDFIRIMLAGKGEKAYRNVGIPILIKQLRKHGELLSAIPEARWELDQHPQYRSTLTEEAKTLDKPLRLGAGNKY